MVWPAVIAAAASLAGGAISSAGSARAAKAQKAEAERNREFQRSMFENRYQMTMADMKKAGLNPILAYQQGAGSPSAGGSSVAPINVASGFGEGIGKAANSAIDARQKSEQAKLLEQQQKKALEETYATATLGSKYQAERNKLIEETKATRQMMEIRKAELSSAKAMEDLYNRYPELRKLEIIRRSLGGGSVVGGILGGVGAAKAMQKKKPFKGGHSGFTVNRDGSVTPRKGGRSRGKFQRKGFKR